MAYAHSPQGSQPKLSVRHPSSASRLQEGTGHAKGAPTPPLLVHEFRALGLYYIDNTEHGKQEEGNKFGPIMVEIID